MKESKERGEVELELEEAEDVPKVLKRWDYDDSTDFLKNTTNFLQCEGLLTTCLSVFMRGRNEMLA